MALKAGYVGVKRKVFEEALSDITTLETSVATMNNSINELMDEVEHVGINLLNNVATTETKSGVTYTVNEDKSISLSGTAEANQTKYIGAFTAKAGQYYKLTGCPAGGGEGTNDYWLGLYVSGQPVGRDTGNEVLGFGGLTDQEYQIYIRIPNGKDTTGMVFKPMITPSNVADVEYVPYMMSISDMSKTVPDLKTAVNAIITAATDAADFAAFKTAMGAITPVTRSLSVQAPETKKASDPEQETKTTKRSTKKTEE